MQVIAHRGMNKQALENTMPAFELALDVADGIELDVRLAGCGTVVVCHDDDLNRLFGDPRRVDELDAKTLRSLRPLDGSDAYIPTLNEVLELVPVDFFLNVEIKAPRLTVNTPTDAVVKILKEQPDRNLVISSFNPLELARAAASGVGHKLGLLFGHDASVFMRHGLTAQVFGSHLSAIHPNWKVVSPWLIEEAHKRDWEINVWTVNDIDRAKWLKKEGVTAVISDLADELLASL